MKDLMRNYNMNIHRKTSVDSDNESTPLASSAASTASFGTMQCMFHDSCTTAGESDIDKPREISPVIPKFTRRPFEYPGGHFENPPINIFSSDQQMYTGYSYFTRKKSSSSLTESNKHNKPMMSISSVIENPKTQSSIVTIFSIWNTMMGTSLLTMAWGIQHAGLFPGILSILLIAGVTLYTTYLVIKVNENHGLGHSDEVAHLCKELLGGWAEIIAKIFSMIVLIGANIVYWVLMSNFLYNSVLFLYGYLTERHDHLPANSTVICPKEMYPFINFTNMTDIVLPAKPKFLEIWDLYTTVPLFLGIIMFPILNFKNVTFFTKFNSLGTFSVLYLMIFVVVKGFSWGINIPDWSIEFEWRLNMTALTGILAMSYFIHNIIICLMKSNENPNNNGRDLSIAFALVTFTYIFIGTIFYVTFPLAKSCIEDNLLNNFEKFDTMTIIARLLLLFQLITVFPLIEFMLRTEILENLRIMFGSCKFSSEFSYFKVVILNLTVIVICILFACFLPRIGTLIRYTGAISGFIHIFTLPCLLKMASLQKEGQLSPLKLLMYIFIIIFGFVNLTSQFFISEH